MGAFLVFFYRASLASRACDVKNLVYKNFQLVFNLRLARIPVMSRSANAIADALENDIVAGEIAPGTRLDETVLSARFGVSRTPVREALHRLASSGFAEQRPRRGTFVRQVSLREMVEMFEVMAELEALSARLAARRLTGDQAGALDAALESCAAAASTGDTDAYYRANEVFHQLIYGASGNRYLAEQARLLQSRLQPYRRLQLRAGDRMRQSLAEHRAIVAAIRSGDGTRVVTEVRAHIMIQGEKFTDLMAHLGEEELSGA